MVWKLEISNIAGIQSGSATVESGVNAVQAENWQGKSSLLTAIETVMGCREALMEGADRGEVELAADDGRYHVALRRDDGQIVKDGEPYLTDEQDRITAELFAFLGERNEVRHAVRAGKSLEDVLLRPLDFENIDEQIAQLQSERNAVETELDRAESAAAELPTVEETITELEAKLSDLKERRAELEAGAESDAVSEKREEYSEAISERERVESQIERLERTVETTTEKIEERREELENLSLPDTSEDLKAEINEAREKKQRAEEAANILQSIYGPMKRILDEERLDLVSDVDHGLMGDNLNCWTCGQETTKDDIEAQLESFREKVSEHQRRANEHRQRIDALTDKRRERERIKRRQQTLESEIDDLEDRLADREVSLQNARERRADLEDQIERLSEEIDDLDDDRTELESEIKYTRTRLEEAREEKADLKTVAERRETLQAEIDALTDEIHQLRDRKERIKREMREAFDEAIQDIITRFEVGFETARLTSTFDLVVARQGREVDLDAMSEGEVELIGIVTALAGYEAFNVDEILPALLVDNLGSLSEENLQTLVEYLTGRPDYLVFTSYPEHSFPDTHVIDPTEWDIATNSFEVST